MSGITFTLAITSPFRPVRFRSVRRRNAVVHAVVPGREKQQRLCLRLMVYCKSKNAKKYRRGVEYGSARWGSPKDIAPYIDPVFDNNILLTQTERLTMNNRPKDPKTARNKNVLVIGGSGSGKTRFFVKPNLMQCVSKDYPTSFVITDPNGNLQ